MHKVIFLITSIIFLVISIVAQAQMESFEPVTDQTLLNPDPGDWLMFSRTYDNQRLSPLDQITRENIDQLELVWSREMYAGSRRISPLYIWV